MKEKIKEHIKRHQFAYSALLILFCFFSQIFYCNSIDVSDELFTFANTYKLHNGINLYSQNNVIDTPLFFWIGNLFLSIFGDNFFVYKIYGIIIFEVIFLLQLNILRKLKVPTARATVYVLLISLPFTKTLMGSGANYNNLAILFCLLGMNFIIKKDDLHVNIIEQGIACALIFATKQNIGIYYLMGLTIFTIYNYRKEIQKVVKKLFGTYAIFLATTMVWLTILIIQGEFKDFINYCFLGIGEFATNHFNFQDFNIVLYAIPIIAFIIACFMKKKEKLKLNDNFTKISVFFACFTFTSLLIGYPIFNIYHIKLALIVPIVYCIYIAEQFVVNAKELFELNIIKKIIIGYISIALIVNIVYLGVTLSRGFYEINYKEPYFSMFATKEMQEKINEVTNFVKLKEKNNQKVIIFSEEANIYQILLEKNYQDFDLPLLGNWGYKGEEKVLEKIKNMEDTFILIKDKSATEQESKKIKDYIKGNYNKTGEIADFEIYYIE